MALRHGLNQDTSGALKISGIMSTGGFEVYNRFKMDYNDDLDVAAGTVTLTSTFTIKQVHIMNTAASDIFVSFNANPSAGNRIRLVGGGAITLDVQVSDVRITAAADNAAFSYVLVGVA